ncbi:ATP-binding protein [Trichothermofontia sp.]
MQDPTANRHFPKLPSQKQSSPRYAFGIAKRSLSLRVKLLVAFSILFSLIFMGAFYWFYTFATEKTLAKLRSDMQATLRGAAKGVDVEELWALYRTGDRNRAGFSDDPRYQRQIQWFATVHQIEPRVWLYSYVVGPADRNRRIGPAAITGTNLEIIYLVDLWLIQDPNKAANFLESAPANLDLDFIREKGLIEVSSIYSDKWGSWLSSSLILNDTGEQLLMLGLDIEADYVLQIQQAIRQQVGLAFIITYGIFFTLIYLLLGVMTRRLRDITNAAEEIRLGNYQIPPLAADRDLFPDEMHTLAQAFDSMVTGIRARESLIRQGKQTEYGMRLALQKERELNELKSRFVSMVSHELRTPMTVIRTSLELLQRYGHLASEVKRDEYFGLAQSAIVTMSQLIDDVLTIGKAEAGKLELNPIDLDLMKFCRGIVQELQVGTSQPIQFIAPSTPLMVYLDSQLLRSILTNLLSNAIKYSPEGAPIVLQIIGNEDEVTLTVQDQGIGIPKEDQTRLFQLFHRASNAINIRGTGLGLAVVKQCVAQHNGQVTFQSQEGKGTTFTVKLPRYAQPVVMEGSRGEV